MPATRNKPAKAPRPANARQSAFAKLRVEGLTHAEAYRAIYNPSARQKSASEAGCRLEAMPAVKAEMNRLREKSARKTLLSLNDRLSILADIAQSDGSTPAARNAKARAIEVYSRISGDQAPDRHEHTGPGGAAIPVAAEVTGNVTAAVVRLPVRERVRLLKEAREREKAERAP